MKYVIGIICASLAASLVRLAGHYGKSSASRTDEKPRWDNGPDWLYYDKPTFLRSRRTTSALRI
jgi:hypothetical protein